MALSWQPLVQTGKKASPPEMGAVQGERSVFSTHSWKGVRSGPPRANQGISKAEPRDNHVLCTLRMHPPTSLYPTLSPEAKPIS